MPPTDEYELLAVKLKSILCDDLCDTLKRIADCICAPPGSQTFHFTGNMGGGCYLSSLSEFPGPGTTILQVPPGFTGVINQVGFYERYPGSMYGTTFSILVNNHAIAEFPRLDRNIGTINEPVSTHIELPEQALVSVHVASTFFPFTSGGDAGSGYIEVVWPYSFSGYYIPVQN
jgi:hypothetical protein